MINEKVHEKDLISLTKNENVKKLCDANYLPELMDMGNDEIYVYTSSTTYSITGIIHNRFFLFNEKGELLTDPKYDYTMINPHGYLLKIIVYSPIQSKNYAIDYLIKVDDIQCRNDTCKVKDHTNNTEKIIEKVTFVSLDADKTLSESFKLNLFDRDKFFNTYIDI